MPTATPQAPTEGEGAHWRAFIAWAAVGLTLAGAIFGSLQGGTSGLTITVSTLAGGATDTSRW